MQAAVELHHNFLLAEFHHFGEGAICPALADVVASEHHLSAHLEVQLELYGELLGVERFVDDAFIDKFIGLDLGEALLIDIVGGLVVRGKSNDQSVAALRLVDALIEHAYVVGSHAVHAHVFQDAQIPCVVGLTIHLGELNLREANALDDIGLVKEEVVGVVDVEKQLVFGFLAGHGRKLEHVAHEYDLLSAEWHC